MEVIDGLTHYVKVNGNTFYIIKADVQIIKVKMLVDTDHLSSQRSHVKSSGKILLRAGMKQVWTVVYLKN